MAAPGAAAHAGACPECGRRLQTFREMEQWLLDLPSAETRLDVGPDLVTRIDRLRAFSGAEKRSFRLWSSPAMLFLVFLLGSAGFLSAPLLTGPEQAGILSALPAVFGLEWKSLLALPGSIWQALPGSVSALSEVLAVERGYAALSILLLLPLGFSIARLWRRRWALR